MGPYQRPPPFMREADKPVSIPIFRGCSNGSVRLETRVNTGLSTSSASSVRLPSIFHNSTFFKADVKWVENPASASPARLETRRNPGLSASVRLVRLPLVLRPSASLSL